MNLFNLLFTGLSFVFALQSCVCKKDENEDITHCETCTFDISASCTSSTKVAMWRQQQSDIKFSAVLWCAACLLFYIYKRRGCGWVWEGWVVTGTGFWKSNDISLRLSVLILYQRVGVRAGRLHTPHPPMAAHKVTFISPAQIFSEVPFTIALTVPSRDLFYFSCLCQAHIIFS